MPGEVEENKRVQAINGLNFSDIARPEEPSQGQFITKKIHLCSL